MQPLPQCGTFRHQSLCLILAALIATNPAAAVLAQPVGAEPTTAVPAEPLNLQYAVPGAVVVVAVRPKQFFTSAAAELFPTEIIQAAAMQEMGLDPLACEELVVSVAPPLQGPPTYSVYARFAQPINLADGRAFAKLEQADIDGKQYFRATRPDPMEPSFLALDANTLLAAPDFAMPSLLKTPAAANPLAAKTAAADRGDDCIAMIDAAQLRPFIFMALGQADLPPEAQPLLQIPNLIKRIEARVNLSRSADSELLLTAFDEDAAKQLVTLFDEAKAQLAAKIRQEIQKSRDSKDPVEQASARYAERMIKLVDERVQLVREGDQIVVARDNVAEGGSPSMNVATTGFLIGLLLPAVQAAREQARRNQSMNNIKQLLLGLLHYESVHNRFPAHATYDDDGKPLLSWRVQILPYLEEQELYEQFHLDEPWDSEHNKQLVSKMPELFLDPSSGVLTPQDGKTHYLGVLGEGYLFDETNEGRQMREITDGLSNTLAVVQVDDDKAVIWTKPDDWQPDATDPFKGLGGLHPAGALAGYCDGSVQFISDMVDPELLLALLTVDGDEDVNNFDR
jgi:hypothetical protein